MKKRNMTKLKWLVSDLGLNEIDAWWRVIWTAALVAAGMAIIL